MSGKSSVFHAAITTVSAIAFIVLYHVRLITYDIAIHAKITQTLSPPAPCSLPPCSPNDKYLTGHDITP